MCRVRTSMRILRRVGHTAGIAFRGRDEVYIYIYVALLTNFHEDIN